MVGEGGITLESWKISHGSSLFISKSPEISFTGIPHVQNSAQRCPPELLRFFRKKVSSLVG